MRKVLFGKIEKPTSAKKVLENLNIYFCVDLNDIAKV